MVAIPRFVPILFIPGLCVGYGIGEDIFRQSLIAPGNGTKSAATEQCSLIQLTDLVIVLSDALFSWDTACLLGSSVP